MIHIKKKQDCCGCAACVQVCPKQCIEMRADNEGFFYPKVCTVNCINCDLCEKVCPVINKNESRVPVNTVAAINTDENVRMKSSSGGIFSLLAKIVIEQDGVVFGVRFDNEWNVIHDYIDKEEDLDHFCGSKYVQSQYWKCVFASSFIFASRKDGLVFWYALSGSRNCINIYGRIMGI